MIVKTSISFFLFFLTGIMNLFSQTYIQPNFGLKIPETLEILRVELSAERTVIYFSIENRIEKGEFCADKNIFILYPDGTRIKLVKAAGIPQCPDYYKFKNIGEKLAFTLTFPPFKTGTKWIDLIEECSNNCFSVYGITLDPGLNGKLDEAYSFADKGETSKAVSILSNILYDIDKENSGIEGSVYTDLITLMIKKGDKAGAEMLYKKMLTSDAPRLNLYIKNLNARGIKY